MIELHTTLWKVESIIQAKYIVLSCATNMNPIDRPDQSTNYLPPCNKVEQARKKLEATFIKEPTILSPRETDHIVNEVVKQHRSIGNAVQIELSVLV
jgi:hypothetical protein